MKRSVVFVVIILMMSLFVSSCAKHTSTAKYTEDRDLFVYLLVDDSNEAFLENIDTVDLDIWFIANPKWPKGEQHLILGNEYNNDVFDYRGDVKDDTGRFTFTRSPDNPLEYVFASVDDSYIESTGGAFKSLNDWDANGMCPFSAIVVDGDVEYSGQTIKIHDEIEFPCEVEKSNKITGNPIFGGGGNNACSWEDDIQGSWEHFAYDDGQQEEGMETLITQTEIKFDADSDELPLLWSCVSGEMLIDVVIEVDDFAAPIFVEVEIGSNGELYLDTGITKLLLAEDYDEMDTIIENSYNKAGMSMPDDQDADIALTYYFIPYLIDGVYAPITP